MTYRRKADNNQKEIVRGLRALGYSVRHIHTVGRGLPDLAIGKHGITCLVEVKQPGEPLTLDEQEFFQAWNGLAVIGHSVEEIHEQFTNAMRSIRIGNARQW